MTTKQKIVSAYVFVALLFTTYGWLFGQFKYRGFFYNLGRGIVWPVHIFPVLGTIVSAVVILALVGLIVFSGSSNKD